MVSAEVRAPLDVHPDQHVTYLLAKVSHVMALQVDRALDEVGLSLVQFSALVHVGRAPGMSVADLARALQTSPQSARLLAKRLEDAGLLVRGDPRPGLPLPLHLTATGREALLAAAPRATAAEARVLDQLDSGLLDQTRLVLEKLLHLASDDG